MIRFLCENYYLDPVYLEMNQAQILTEEIIPGEYLCYTRYNITLYINQTRDANII